MDFKEWVKERVRDDMIGLVGEEVDTSELADLLTEPYRIDGFALSDEAAARRLVAESPSAVGETIDFFLEEYDLELDPEEDPCGFTFYMLDYGVRELVAGNVEVVGRWGEEVEVTPELAASILGTDARSVERLARQRDSGDGPSPAPRDEPAEIGPPSHVTVEELVSVAQRCVAKTARACAECLAADARLGQARADAAMGILGRGGSVSAAAAAADPSVTEGQATALLGVFESGIGEDDFLAIARARLEPEQATAAGRLCAYGLSVEDALARARGAAPRPHARAVAGEAASAKEKAEARNAPEASIEHVAVLDLEKGWIEYMLDGSYSDGKHMFDFAETGESEGVLTVRDLAGSKIREEAIESAPSAPEELEGLIIERATAAFEGMPASVLAGRPQRTVSALAAQARAQAAERNSRAAAARDAERAAPKRSQGRP